MITPKLPDIDGVDYFAGITMHTARWDHDQDLTGKRVADHRHRRIRRAGHSGDRADRQAAQRLSAHADLVLPQVRRTAAARWRAGRCGSRRQDRPAPAQSGLRRGDVPAAGAVLHRLPDGQARRGAARAYLRQQVDDPVVRDKLTPRYAVGCKRPGFHNTYLSTFNRDNVELVTEPIDKITGSGVATADGDTHEVDVLILATGFKVMDVDVLTYPVTGAAADP